jgi:hypothetical protein
MHRKGSDEAARLLAIDRLGWPSSPIERALERLLGRVHPISTFAAVFINRVAEERVGYIAQVGLPAGGYEELRRLPRESTFCTHCVASGEPLIVENAAAEAFFRSSEMVLRNGAVAYVGVPVRTSAGLAIATLCALDRRPRVIDEGLVRVLELFAEHASIVIEGSEQGRKVVEPRAEGDLYSAGWFSDLLAALIRRRAADRGSATLVVCWGAGAEPLVQIAEAGETAGVLEDGAFGLVLAGAEGEAVERRLEQIRGRLEGVSWGHAPVERAMAVPGDWVARARRGR